MLSERQLRANEYYLVDDIIHQTNVLLNEKFMTVFEQLIAIENEPALKGLVLSRYTVPGQDKDKYYFIIELNKKFEDIYYSHFQMLDSIYFYLNDGTELELFKEFVPVNVGVTLDNWIHTYNYSDNGYYWLNNHEDKIFTSVDKREVVSVFKIIGTDASDVKGLLAVNLKSSYFQGMLKGININKDGYIMLVSKDGVLYSRDIEDSCSIGEAGMDFIRENTGNSGSFYITSNKGNKLFVAFNTLGINHWVIAAVIPEDSILEGAGRIKYVSLAVIAILTIVSISFAVVFAGSFSKKIRYLSIQVKKFEEGDMKVKFDITGSNEIGILAKGLSSLVGAVDELLKRVKEEQEKKRRIELKALQSQINPHFLYNTLGSIKHLIDMGENARASMMAGALTKFFMIGLSKGKEIIKVREELEHAEKYFMIQKMRYSREFNYFIEVEDEVKECEIPKLTLQPLIENSIYHGIKNKADPGIIKVTGWRDIDGVVLEVYDNGAGIGKDALARLDRLMKCSEDEERQDAFGLRNVDERLRLHFGWNYGLEIKSAEGEFTIVKVKIPYGDEEIGHAVNVPSTQKHNVRRSSDVETDNCG